MTRLGRTGELAAWAISVLAWAISYATQARLAQSTGAFPGWEAWAWPATVDLASLAAMVLALDQARRGRSSSIAWGIAVLAAAVMVAANTAADWPHPVAMAMHSWPPVIALACWLLLVHERRRDPSAGAVSAESEDDSRRVANAPSPGTEAPKVNPRSRPPARRKVDREAAFAVIAAHDGKLSGRALAKAIGASHPIGTQLLEEWRSRNGS